MNSLVLSGTANSRAIRDPILVLSGTETERNALALKHFSRS